MIGHELLHQPRSLALRQWIFTIHLWIGVAIAVYVLLICITGSVLVFRPELERIEHRDLYPVVPADAASVPLIEILGNVRSAYPEDRIAALYTPSPESPAYSAFVERNGLFRTVLLAPDSGIILGERPDTGFIRSVQLLHTNLLANRAGRLANGLGAVLLLILCVTGPLIWWPGIDNWRDATWVDFRRSWKRVAWELHGATGFWIMIVLAMWAFTGAYFVVPQPFQRAVGMVSSLTNTGVPRSSEGRIGQERVDIASLIARAEADVPDGNVAGVVLPATERGSVAIQVARAVGSGGSGSQVHFAFDQYTGELLKRRDELDRSWGDTILSWIIPLHFGTFGGLPIRVLWFVLGLLPVILAVTGVVMWWNRAVRPTIATGDSPVN